MSIKKIGFAGLLCLFLTACQPKLEYAVQGPKVNAQDFVAITGDWVGTLTYTDYNSGMPTEIATKASVTSISDSNIQYTIFYPNEPWQDSQSTLTISKDGRLIDEHVISQRVMSEDGSLTVITQYRGEDDNRPADIRQTYGLSQKNFYIRKDVKFDDSETYLQRNKYVFMRFEK